MRSHLGGSPADLDVELAALRLGRLDRGRSRQSGAEPSGPIVTLQVAVALFAIVGGAAAFVGAVSRLSLELGLAPAVLALIIAPIATELPEKFNSVLWIGHGKDTLAIGNITGAMVFQSCLPVIVAILFAPHSWLLTGASLPTFTSAGIAFLSTGVIFWPLLRGGVLTGRRLLLGGGFYVAYLGFLVATLGTV